METDHEADDLFRDAVQGLHNGDFSRLEPLFSDADGDNRRARIIDWHEAGRFHGEPKALAEALTCACFLGRTRVAEYPLRNGVDPSGGAGTGLNALHWAANRGQLAAVQLLLDRHTPLGTRTMYGGNVLDTAIWSAINEPRPGQREVIEELLKNGAQLENEKWPTGDAEIDALLQRYRPV